MNPEQLKNIIEAALLAAGRPLTMDALLSLFDQTSDGDAPPGRDAIQEALGALDTDYLERGIELKQVASGYRIQVRQDYADWMGRLWSEKPSRYSRALLETLVLIAYRQPITRAEIEDVRGVAVSSNIVRTLLEREWVRVVGHRDVPGKPAMYGSTKQFLDYFNLKSLGDLPTLAEIRDIDEITGDLFKEELAAIEDYDAFIADIDVDEVEADILSELQAVADQAETEQSIPEAMEEIPAPAESAPEIA